MPSISRTSSELAGGLSSKDPQLLREIVKRIVVTPGMIEIARTRGAMEVRLGYEPAESVSLVVTSEVRLSRTGRALRLVDTNGRSATPTTADPGLVLLLVRARGWWSRLTDGETDIARDEQVNDSWISRVIRLNFLAPTIVEAILAGTAPIGGTAAALRSADIPNEWDDQLAYFGM